MVQTEEQKPIMVIGPVGAGKSTLLSALKYIDGEVRKTQSIKYTPLAIDTPGEMMQIPYLYNSFILNSSRARAVFFLVSANQYNRMPPKIALALKAPAYGIVSKIDSANEDQIRRAEALLHTVGVKTLFRISSVTGEGLEELRKFLDTLQN